MDDDAPISTARTPRVWVDGCYAAGRNLGVGAVGLVAGCCVAAWRSNNTNGLGVGALVWVAGSCAAGRTNRTGGLGVGAVGFVGGCCAGRRTNNTSGLGPSSPREPDGEKNDPCSLAAQDGEDPAHVQVLARVLPGSPDQQRRGRRTELDESIAEDRAAADVRRNVADEGSCGVHQRKPERPSSTVSGQHRNPNLEQQFMFRVPAGSSSNS